MSLYIFDQGGTLIQPIRPLFGLPKPPTTPEEQVLYPGVWEKIGELRAAGHAIAIATNQEMVAWGKITLQQAEELVENCAAKIGGVDAWIMCPYHPAAQLNRYLGKPVTEYARDDFLRKPHPGMILGLIAALKYPPEDTFMVGNKSVDRRAAKLARVRFIRAKKFFKSESK
ncbi:MAG TPA: HAD-IIIA family hydrolase [Anaerolineae bacterium]|nr:HAD-IIIA family hydrolase [Anaerolineae bacterium]